MTKLSSLLFRYLIKDAITISDILILAFYKLPSIGHQLIPFITLFAAIATFRNLSERQELVTMRSAGLSVWQFIIPIVSITFFLSLFYMAILHPLSTAATSRYESLENVYFGDGVETITIIDGGLWLRQEDKTGHFILKANDIDAQKWGMDDVSVFFFDISKTHTQRIDAISAQLKPKEWVFHDVTVHKKNAEPIAIPILKLSTTLTSDSIAESFSNPETISFWRMPYFIQSIDKTGLDTTEIRAHYQTLLSQPLLLVAMIFMAAVISLKTQRTSRLLPIIISTLAFGFIAFFMTGFLKALSLGHEIPLILGIWSAPIIILLLAVTLLTRLEDG